MDAVDCLRLHFLGNFDDFIKVSDQDVALAQFLAAVSVLSPNESGSKFRMSSPMIDSFNGSEITSSHPSIDFFPPLQSPRNAMVDP